MKILTIIDAIKEAQGSFTECNWTMDLSGDELAAYETKVRDAALQAQDYAVQAIFLLNSVMYLDKMKRVYELIRDASILELQFGDYSDYRKALKLIEEALVEPTDLASLMSYMQFYSAVWSDPPKFGGPEPEDTSFVWSWDEESVLMGSCSDDLQIISREEWKEINANYKNY